MWKASLSFAIKNCKTNWNCPKIIVKMPRGLVFNPLVNLADLAVLLCSGRKSDARQQSTEHKKPFLSNKLDTTHFCWSMMLCTRKCVHKYRRQRDSSAVTYRVETREKEMPRELCLLRVKAAHPQFVLRSVVSWIRHLVPASAGSEDAACARWVVIYPFHVVPAWGLRP